MSRVTDNQANLLLRPYYQILYEAAESGFKEYTESPHAAIHCARSAATNINDHIWAQLINRLDGTKGITPLWDRRKGLRFIKVECRRPLLLWIKRVDRNRRHSIYPTAHASQMLESGQAELFPRAEILVLGYTIKQDGLGILRVSINPPCSKKTHPDWWIDIVPVTRIKVARAGGQLQIKVNRSRQDKFGI